jgi:hypothetical protein
VASGIAASEKFGIRHGGMDDAAFVASLYADILGRDGR